MTLSSTHELLPVKRAGQLEEKAPELRYLVDKLWLDGAVGVIGGLPKNCKTWAGLDLAVSVASGTPCLGRFEVVGKGPTMVYLAEDSLPMVRERLGAVCLHRNLPLDDLDLHVITVPRLRLDLASDQARLQRTLAHYRPRLLLLDPFVRLHNIDENQAQEVTPLLDYLRELQRTLSLSVVLVHHMRKNGSARQQGQALRGSGDIHAWLDCAWYLTREGDQLKLTVEHRAAPAPEPLFLRLEPAPPHLEVAKPPTSAKPSLEDRLLDILSRTPAPLTRGQLRKQLRVNNARLGQTLRQLQDQSRVKRTPSGYTL